MGDFRFDARRSQGCFKLAADAMGEVNALVFHARNITVCQQGGRPRDRSGDVLYCRLHVACFPLFSRLPVTIGPFRQMRISSVSPSGMTAWSGRNSLAARGFSGRIGNYAARSTMLQWGAVGSRCSARPPAMIAPLRSRTMGCRDVLVLILSAGPDRKGSNQQFGASKFE